MRSFLRRCIGDRAFYRTALGVAVPIMIQNGITNFVGMLDNIMIGRLGTESMSGVSIVNQYVFVFSLIIFGAVSAAGIFTAQYHGAGDVDGVRHTFRFKVAVTAGAALLCAGLLFFSGDGLIGLFLHEGTEGDLALTLAEGKKYLLITLAGLLPFAVTQAYASTLRETGCSVPPMIASIVAVVCNFVLNLVLIFGLLGFPRLGVAGAAWATIIARAAELAVLVVWTHRRRARCPWAVGAYRSFVIPRALFASVAVKGLPLMLNELFWSLAITLRNQCYATRGLDAVAAQNIASVIYNMFSIVFLALGAAVAIIVGNRLGAGEREQARDASRKLIAFSVVCSMGLGLILFSLSRVFPLVYNTGENVRSLAAFMIAVSALAMPFSAFTNAAYFTIRSGGRILVTLLFDSVFMWTVVMPVAFLLSRLTPMDIRPLYAVCQMTEILKCALGLWLLLRIDWVRSLVDTAAPAEASDAP